MFNAQTMREQADKKQNSQINQLLKEVTNEDKVTEVISVMMENIEDKAREDVYYVDFELTEDVLNDYKEYVDEVLNIFKSRGYSAFISNTTLTIAYGTLSKKDDTSNISDLHQSIVPQMETIHNLMPDTFYDQALEIIEELKVPISKVANKGGYEYRTNDFGFNEYIDKLMPSVQNEVKEKLEDLGFLVEIEFISSDYGHELVIRW